MAVVVWSAITVLVLVAGAWWGDRGGPADGTESVAASAVVVSSLACANGAGNTLVDVLPASPLAAPVRATLEACGYQEGQQLAVQYAAAAPTRVVLAGATPTGGGLLPLGVAIAALLALGAGLAVWIDSRRPTRHRADASGRHLGDHETPDPRADSTTVADRPDPDAGERTAAQYAGERIPAAGGRQAGADLIFPFSSTLAASLHDELFTHRSVSS